MTGSADRLRRLAGMCRDAGENITAELAVELLNAEAHLKGRAGLGPDDADLELESWLRSYWLAKEARAEGTARQAFETVLLEPRDYQLLGELVTAVGELLGPRERLAALPRR